jgi:hypothetical protein
VRPPYHPEAMKIANVLTSQPVMLITTAAAAAAAAPGASEFWVQRGGERQAC